MDDSLIGALGILLLDDILSVHGGIIAEARCLGFLISKFVRNYGSLMACCGADFVRESTDYCTRFKADTLIAPL